jgi:hypothetical protein
MFLASQKSEVRRQKSGVRSQERRQNSGVQKTDVIARGHASRRNREE